MTELDTAIRTYALQQAWLGYTSIAVVPAWAVWKVSARRRLRWRNRRRRRALAAREQRRWLDHLQFLLTVDLRRYRLECCGTSRPGDWEMIEWE